MYVRKTFFHLFSPSPLSYYISSRDLDNDTANDDTPPPDDT